MDESSNKEENSKKNDVQPEIPKLSQNAQKLKDLEDKMSNLEISLSELKLNISQNKENRLKQTEEVYLIHKETKEINDKIKLSISDKIKSSFLNEFDIASRHVVENENKRKVTDDLNYEFRNIISELEFRNDLLLCDKKNLEDQNLSLKGEYEFLKEGYEECIKENANLRNENQQKDEKIKNLEEELKDMKNVISKLTEIRVILNKYFSSHFENFTPQEKKIIQDVEGTNTTNTSNKKKIMNEYNLLI